ncbi:MAG TPA: exo-beta-N-acetylmuramidase NamZ domain-containing protein [Planctomycetota bacterium]|nr:exo-beta-N-acetylmuramidase NamZ domain-containing protein [Planctomycetota bacterium]
MRKTLYISLTFFLSVLLAGCSSSPSAPALPAAPAKTPATVAPAAPSAPPAPKAVFQPSKLAEMDAAITAAIAEKRMPGAVLWLEHNGESYHRAYGNRALVPDVEPMTEDTIFDAASLTKVLATAPSVMLLIERGKIKLDEPVCTYLPEFTGDGKERVTVRHLLTHTSGLRPGIGLSQPGSDEAFKQCCAEKLTAAPGTEFKYSDVGFILLGELVRRVSGRGVDAFAASEIYAPLKMSDTRFLPDASLRSRIAPTEKRGEEILRGSVHDPKCARMGGVAGHAGLFTTAADIARFARMMLSGGTGVFKPETIALMTSVHTPETLGARRGLGWDIDTGYSRPRGQVFPLGSYGHTGFTGTCLWIDPFSKSFWILLTNRVHPDGKGNILPLQAALGTLAAEAIADFDFGHVPGALPKRPADVLNGIDSLAARNFTDLKGLKIGLITNQTGIDRKRNATIDLLKAAPGVTLKALFCPEHGIRGDIDAKVSDSVDEKTGLPVYSLYGESRAPKAEQLAELDALVFDIQDIGCRFYTYMSTLGLSLEAASKSGKIFFVLDRVNPVNGVDIEGPVHGGESTFTAFHSIPVRHGMTAGELAKMFNDERGFNAQLTVIPLENWSRKMWFDETGLPWINPSPNMRSVAAAGLYPGVGLLEFTSLSVGRGTDRPFEVFGAPYVDDLKFTAAMNRLNLPGVRFYPVRFTPAASVFKGQLCGGVGIVVTDRAQCASVDIGIAAATTLNALYPREFTIEKFNVLLADVQTLNEVKKAAPLQEIKRLWAEKLDSFKVRRQKYLLYK